MSASAGPESLLKKDRAVTVQAFADRKNLIPGQPVNLAVRLRIEDGWHIYWRSPGGASGMPTRIDWKLPSEFQQGRTQFPIPAPKYDKALEETSYVLEGSPVMVTPLRVPASVHPGDQIELTATVSWLMCRKECIPGQAQVSLTLPVAGAGAKLEAANVSLFENARASFPLPPEKAEHAKISGVTRPSLLKPGEKAAAVLSVEVEAGHHMQSYKPNQPGLIPANIFSEQTAGLEIGDGVYPKADDREDKVLGRLSEYSGRTEFTIPISVDDDADKSPRWIRGIFQYQICTDAGVCFRPQHVEFVIPVQMAGGPVPPLSPDTWMASAAAAPTRQAPAASDAPASAITRLQDWLLSFGFTGALLVAFIGGLLLNVMPCVLPVISLKILSFVRQSHEHRGQVFRLGLTYSAGILVFFSVLAVLFTLGGQGWGQLFQSPRVILGLAAIVTAFAMSLFGVWAVFTPRVINQLGEKAEGEGYSSAFFTGVLATILGTACTAPFLSAALGAASRFNAAQGAGIFLAVGAGMSLPFVILAANPAWLRFLPKPGPWMATFEAGMGFFLLGTVIWLLNPLRGQLGDYGLLLALIFLLAVALSTWVKGKMRFGDSAARKAKVYALSIAILILGWLLPFRFMSTINELVSEQMERQEIADAGERARASHQAVPLVDIPDWSKDKIQWKRYKRDRAFATVDAGYTVFIDYTADWCANCKAMLKSAIERPDTIKAMKELNVVAYTADYTLPMPEIKDDLDRFKRGGVPVFVVYKPGNTRTPEILPEIIDTKSLVEALRRAGPSNVQFAQKP